MGVTCPLSRCPLLRPHLLHSQLESLASEAIGATGEASEILCLNVSASVCAPVDLLLQCLIDILPESTGSGTGRKGTCWRGCSASW